MEVTSDLSISSFVREVVEADVGEMGMERQQMGTHLGVSLTVQRGKTRQSSEKAVRSYFEGGSIWSAGLDADGKEGAGTRGREGGREGVGEGGVHLTGRRASVRDSGQREIAQETGGQDNSVPPCYRRTN